MSLKNNATLYIDKEFTVGKIDNRIYGSFIEHMERVVYEGIYEPSHPLSDELGFRKDILELVKEMQIPIFRYPGGNFLSGYNWEDGVGPVEKRPVKMDLAWIAYDNNRIGLNEFMQWAKRADTDVNMAVNLGTRGADEARNLVEYCNHKGGSYWSDLRKSHGVKEPYKIKTWCLGNEMDGPWQICTKTAVEYGRLALETGKLMKLTDKSIELVACGSSNDKLETYPEWDATVLDYVYPVADYISLHNYYTVAGESTPTFLAHGMDMDRQIKTIISTCDYVKAKKKSNKTINLSFDEWGIWNEEEKANRAKWTYDWEDANAISEGSYTFEDALLTGSIMMTLINNSDRVKIACQAQLVNHLSLINCAKGGRAWKQTIFYPFLHASLYGRGTALVTKIKCSVYETKEQGIVDTIHSAAVHNEEKGELVLFLLNRDVQNDVVLDCRLCGFSDYRPIEHIAYENDDLKAVNTLEKDNIVPIVKKDFSKEDGSVKVQLSKASWNVLRLKKT